MRKLKIISYFCLSFVMVIGLMTIAASGGGGSGDTTTFSDNGGDICTEGGKPVIRMFSTSTCPHCAWSAQAFDPVVQSYVNQGLIFAHHWEIDTGDDLLTSEVEDEVPASEMTVYNTYSPQSYVPAFVFGCRYIRIGTGHESSNDVEAEEDEFIDLIEELLDSVP